MKVVVVIQVAQKAGSSISWRTLGLLFLIAEYRLKTTHTHTHTQQGSSSLLKVLLVKDFAYLYFYQGKA